MTDIKRDRWDRPLILQPDGREIAYTRASTAAKALDDLNALMAWKARKTAEGLVKRPDLMSRVSGVLATGNPDDDWSAKRTLNGVVDEAMEAAGATTARNAGSAMHSLTEAVDMHTWPLWISDEDEARLVAYAEAVRHMKALEAETFVVLDNLKVAGSFDRLWRLPDGRVVVGDLKTGKSEADYPLSTAMQLAFYAHGRKYDPETGRRSKLHADLDTSVGLLIHLPASGGCKVIPLDLVKGWHAAQTAAMVHHEIRKWKPADLYVPLDAGVVA
jgi:hypothetical protein